MEKPPIATKQMAIEVQVSDPPDRSVEVISAIQQVMAKYDGELSPNGRDRRAVYEWFMARYNPETFKLMVNRGD